MRLKGDSIPRKNVEDANCAVNPDCRRANRAGGPGIDVAPAALAQISRSVNAVRRCAIAARGGPLERDGLSLNRRPALKLCIVARPRGKPVPASRARAMRQERTLEPGRIAKLPFYFQQAIVLGDPLASAK